MYSTVDSGLTITCMSDALLLTIVLYTEVDARCDKLRQPSHVLSSTDDGPVYHTDLSIHLCRIKACSQLIN